MDKLNKKIITNITIKLDSLEKLEDFLRGLSILDLVMTQAEDINKNLGDEIPNSAKIVHDFIKKTKSEFENMVLFFRKQ